MSIVLTETQKGILSKLAIDESPNESCALLFGKIKNDHYVVSDIFLADNSEESPIEFTISNNQLLEGYQEAEKRNLDVIGIFHSHPDSEPFPSSTDKKFMEVNPVAWLIYSVVTKKFKAYILDSNIIEIPIETL